MRKGINGLTQFLSGELHANPQNGNLYLFRNRRGDKIKIIHWHRNGFMVHYKCLEKGLFTLPDITDNHYEISVDQLQWLIAGLDFISMNNWPELNYNNYC